MGWLALTTAPWQPSLLLGWHDCDLCEEPDGPTSFEHRDRRVEIGVRNLFVPAPGLGVLVAPSMVLHYIDVHGYRPPDAFLDAVRRCPPMDSDAYFEALHDAGGASLLDLGRTT